MLISHTQRTERQWRFSTQNFWGLFKSALQSRQLDIIGSHELQKIEFNTASENSGDSDRQQKYVPRNAHKNRESNHKISTRFSSFLINSEWPKVAHYRATWKTQHTANCLNDFWWFYRQRQVFYYVRRKFLIIPSRHDASKCNFFRTCLMLQKRERQTSKKPGQWK